MTRLEAAVSNPLHDATVVFERLLGPSGILAYLTYMGERLVEMRRLLKRTASLYLHCDPTASHYLKALADDLFGHQNHRNEVIWERTTGRKAGRQYGQVHNVVLFYSKTKANVWNSPTIPQSEETVRGHVLMRDEGSLFRQSDFSGAGEGPPHNFGNRTIASQGRHWIFDQEGVDRLMREERIVF